MKKNAKKVDIIIVVVLLLLTAWAVLAIVIPKKTEPAPQENASPVAAAALSPADYNGKRLGIMTGSSFEQVTFEKFPDSEYFYFDSTSDMIVALLSNKIDGFVQDEPVMKMAHSENSRIDYFKDMLVTDNYSFGFSQNERCDKLLAEFNVFLSEMKESGELDSMGKKWFEGDEASKVFDDSPVTGENGNITVAVIPDNVPFSYTSNNKLVGYVVELCTLFGRKYGYSVTFEQANITACLAGIASGKYDILAGSISVTEERKQSMNFSDTFYYGGMVLAVRSEDISGSTAAPAKKLKDYAGKRIGVQTGTTFDLMVQEAIPDAEISHYNSYTDLLLALKSGNIDAFGADEPIISYMMSQDDSIAYLDDYMDEYEFGFACTKSDKGETLCAQMSEYIRKIKADGTLAEINDIWFGSDKTKQVPPPVDSLPAVNGTVNFAVEAANAPFVYLENDDIVGYEVDIAYRFCKEYGYELEIWDMSFDSIIPAVQSGKCDIGAASMTITPERAENVNFTEPDYKGGAVLAVRAEDVAAAAYDETALATNADFNGKRAGVITGTMHEDIVEKYLPDSEMFLYNSYSDLVGALNSGKIDYFLMNAESVEHLKAENPDLDYVKEPIEMLEVGAMFPKTEKGDKIRAQFDEFLNKIISDGTRDEIYAHWSSPDVGSDYVDMSGLTGENGTLVLATAGDEMPGTYIANGNIAGTDPDIAERFCRECGYGLEVIIVDTAGTIPGIISGKFDFAMADFVITEERKESVNFSIPYNWGGINITARKSDLIKKTAVPAEQEGSGDSEQQTFLEGLASSFEKNFIREERWKLIVQGIGTTCIITVMSALFGTLLAFLVCLFRRTGSTLANMISNLYVKLLQGTPIVVLLMILYYVVFGKSGINAVWVAVIGFSLNLGAYVSEIMRSGIDSIDSGQREAALALGFSENQAFFKFIFPQAAVRFLPVYKGEMISLLKSTSIVGYIAIQDLTKMSDIIRSRTYEAFFPLIATAVIYFALAWIITVMLKVVLNRIDPRVRKRGTVK